MRLQVDTMKISLMLARVFLISIRLDSSFSPDNTVFSLISTGAVLKFMPYTKTLIDKDNYAQTRHDTRLVY